jgi:GWxTD domain-containing protein
MILFLSFLIGLNADFQIDRDTNFIPYVIVNYGIPYSDLVFYKNDTVYTGEYLVSLVLKKDGYQLGGISKKHKILVYDYKKTISANFYQNDFVEMKIPEGKTEITLTVSDLNSSRVWKRLEKIDIAKLEPVDIGSIRWLSNSSREVFTDKDTVKIRLNILNTEKSKIQLVIYFRDQSKSTLFKKDTILPYKVSQSIEIFIPASRFDEGFYNFFAEVKNVNKKEIVKKSISFTVSKPFFESKRFLERVSQMEYITSPREMDGLLHARIEEREKIWNEFWDSKDPTPNDGINEVRIAYFERVDLANDKFGRSSVFEGWRTDRGKTYIILGPPDYIEDEPYSVSSPDYYAYQIWYYYNKGYNLIFIQRYMTGDYDLQNPPPEFWR